MAGPRTLIFALLTLAFLLPAIADEADVETLHRRVMDAEMKATELTTRLETLYLAVQADFELFRNKPWRRLAAPLVAATERRMDGLRTDPEKEGKALGDEFAAADVVTEASARRLAAAAAARAAELERGESMSAADLLKHAAGVVFPKETFPDCWDARFTDLPLVTEWKEANEVLAKAKAAHAAATKESAVEPNAPAGMVLVPEGRYVWGPWTGWENGLKKNKAGKTKVAAFFIDVTEVTNGRYRKFLEAAPKKQREGLLAEGFSLDDEGDLVVAKGWDARMPARGMTHPAATACAKYLGKRLPTEAEWEIAARGDGARVYPWGDEFGKGVSNTKETGKGGPVPVGTMKHDRSPFGVLDMGGNVSEMTSTLKNRDRVKGKLGPEHAFIHRGGNYDEDEESARVSHRFPIMAVRKREPAVGFRCALSKRDWKRK